MKNRTAKFFTSIAMAMMVVALGFVCIFNANVAKADGSNVAKIGTTEYATLQDAVTAAQVGDEIVLLSDVTLTEKIVVSKSLTVDGGNFTVTTNADKLFEISNQTDDSIDATFKNFKVMQNNTVKNKARAFDTRNDNINLTLSGVTVTVTNCANAQPITIGGSESEKPVNITIENSNINAGASGYAIISFVKANVSVSKNSTISGYAAMYCKDGSAGSVVTFENSTISATTHQNESFGAIVVEMDDATVSLKDTDVIVDTTSNPESYAVVSVSSINLPDGQYIDTTNVKVAFLGDSSVSGEGVSLTKTDDPEKATIENLTVSGGNYQLGGYHDTLKDAYDGLVNEYTTPAQNRLNSIYTKAVVDLSASQSDEGSKIILNKAIEEMQSVLTKKQFELAKAEQISNLKLYCASKGVDYKTFAEANKDKFEYDAKVTEVELYQVTETLMSLVDDTAKASQGRWSTDKLVKIVLALNVITLLLVFMISRKKKEVPAKSQEGENKEEQKPAPVQKGDFFSYNANKTFVPTAVTVDEPQEEPFAELEEENAFANLKANDKTFEERLAEAEDIVKQGYQEINAKLLSYKKVNVRVSKKYVSYRVGRQLVAKLTIRGKTLRCYLALDPETYEVTKLHHKDESEFSSYKEVPMMMRVRSNRAIKNTVRLVEDIATKYSLIAK